MQYNDFLNTTKVIRMLYGADKARKFFSDNIIQYEEFFKHIDLFVEK